MNGKIKIEAKQKMLGNTSELFLESFISALVTAICVISVVLATVILLNEPIISQIKATFGATGAYLTVGAVLWIMRALAIAVISSIRLGEKSVYYRFAKDGTFSYKGLFAYMSPKKSLYAFKALAEPLFFKLFWIILAFFPAVFCATVGVFMLLRTEINTTLSYVMLGAGLLLFVFGILFFYATSRRYFLVPFFALDETAPIKSAVFASAKHSDTAIFKRTRFGLSMLGWRILALLPFSSIYALPYCNLANAMSAYKALQEAEIHPPFLPIAIAKAKE